MFITELPLSDKAGYFIPHYWLYRRNDWRVEMDLAAVEPIRHNSTKRLQLMLWLSDSSQPGCVFCVCVSVHVPRVCLSLGIHWGVQRVTLCLRKLFSVCESVCGSFIFVLSDSCLFRYAIFLRRHCEGNHLRLISPSWQIEVDGPQVFWNHLHISYSAVSCTVSWLFWRLSPWVKRLLEI